MTDVARLAFRVPILGWLLHDAIAGLPDAKYYFAANLALTLIALIYLFGYPLLITLAVFAAFAGLTMIVVLTAIDAFGRTPKRSAPAASRRPKTK